jgi:hypothetical protein
MQSTYHHSIYLLVYFTDPCCSSQASGDFPAFRRLERGQHDNAFGLLDSPGQVDTFADGFQELPSPKLLNPWTHPFIPLPGSSRLAQRDDCRVVG